MPREVTEVTRTVREDSAAVVEDRQDPDGGTVAERVIYLLGGILLVLLALRVLLSLLGANRANGFADFIYGVTYPFVAPFFGLFGYDVSYGVSRFEIETVVAIVVYALLIALLARLATLNRPRRSVR
jgi:hypothetical protein